LQCKAVLEGEHFVINGQKIWTSGAHHADWMFALVRTDADAPKHEGISFVFLDMHQSGVKVEPIRLISGSSPFCETFFSDALARRDDMVGELNKGWAVSKKLLQFERAASSEQRDENPYAIIARQYLGQSAGRIPDSEVRGQITRQIMLEKSLDLTIARVTEESRSGSATGAAASIFKLVGSTVRKEASSLKSRLRGVSGVGWEGNGFSDGEIKSTREWLRDRAVTIYGGTDEIQKNIISKRVLGLPD
jgi:alkylation response protein AidB-like acyl-CoA dehydrogenase